MHSTPVRRLSRATVPSTLPSRRTLPSSLAMMKLPRSGPAGSAYIPLRTISSRPSPSSSTLPRTPLPRTGSLLASSNSVLLAHLARSFASPAPPTSAPASTAATTATASDAADASKEAAKASSSSKEVAKPKQSMWDKVKHEAKHYWHGTKLLGHEIKISSKLQLKVLNGQTLTRREQRQLKRTTADLLRLIPFSVFVIIPGLELLLPVFLKFFPNMLPSTFEDKFAAEEKQRKLLRVRINMAKFLQETISESGLKANDVVKSDEFKQFFRKVRSTGESPSTEDIIKVAKLFQSDVTLDNLSRPQIVSMCRYMKIHAFGTDNFLRHQIQSRLAQIRRDDQVILSEGVDSLSVAELQMACQSRGVRFTGVSPSALRKELESWIDLHYTNKISGVLLVLSRAFHFNEQGADVVKSLEATLASLPDNLLSEAELEVLGEGATPQERLEVLKQQQELIDEEAEQEHEEEQARKEKKELDDRIKAEEKTRREEEQALREQEESTARSLLPEAELQEHVEPEAEQEDARMTKEQLHELAEALSILSAKSSIVKERNELKALMDDNIASEEESKLHPDEVDKKEVSLSKRIRSMIKKIDVQLEEYDAKVGGSLKLIEVDANGKISLADLEKALQVIKHKPDEDSVQTLMGKLDSDHDGFVVLDEVIELTQDYGLGVVIDPDAQKILGQGADLKPSPDVTSTRPKKEDILA